MATRHINNYYNWKMQIITIMRHYFISIRWEKIKKSDNNWCYTRLIGK